MLTESEEFALLVLKKRYDADQNIYYPAKSIGEDELFLSRSTPTFRPISSAALVLGNLLRKQLVDVVLMMDDYKSPVRLYKINENGINQINVYRKSALLKIEQLSEELSSAFSKVESCLGSIEEIKKRIGMS